MNDMRKDPPKLRGLKKEKRRPWADPLKDWTEPGRTEDDSGEWFTYHDVIPFHVVDGDTADFLVNVGLDTFRKIRVRFHDFDAWELRRGSDEEKAKGRAAAEALETFVQLGELTLETRTDKTGKYGRYLVRLCVHPDDGSEPVYLADWMAERGHRKA